jgi:hypothetical protein
MYAVQCYAGFPMPVKVGRMRVCHIRATISDPTKAASLKLIDDMGIVEGNSDSAGTIVGRILTDDFQKVAI